MASVESTEEKGSNSPRSFLHKSIENFDMKIKGAVVMALSAITFTRPGCR